MALFGAAGSGRESRSTDARNNTPRIGRVLMAVGRDAADVAITTNFGSALLTQFTIVSDEIKTPVGQYGPRVAHSY